MAQSIQVTKDGGYIVAGNSGSSNGDVKGNHGSFDCWIVKLDINGAMQWSKCYGGSASDAPHAIIQTSDGGYLFAANTFSTNGDVTGFHGFDDYWIVKIDAVGNLVWEKTFGGSDDDEPYDTHLWIETKLQSKRETAF